MKKITTLMLMAACVMLAAETFAQTIRRVNNNPGITLDANMYSTIQAAHDAATSGDIIYLEASVSSYGDLVATKPLTIVGTGYLLNENHIYQRATEPSKIGNVTFKIGSSGSTLEGTRVDGLLEILRASNITIKRNYIMSNHIRVQTLESGQQSTYSSISNITITGNFVNALLVYPSKDGVTNYTVSNLTVANNRINSIHYSDNATFQNLVTSAAIYNNVLSYVGKIWNTSVHNNIWMEPNGSTLDLSGSNNTISNNLSADIDCLPAGNGNVNGIILADTFLGFTGNTEDSQWKLKSGSPAIGAGVGGVDCGMFGGATPYVLSGVPSHPTINVFNTTGVGNSSTPLNVTISTKSNN